MNRLNKGLLLIVWIGSFTIFVIYAGGTGHELQLGTFIKAAVGASAMTLLALGNK